MGKNGITMYVINRSILIEELSFFVHIGQYGADFTGLFIIHRIRPCFLIGKTHNMRLLSHLMRYSINFITRDRFKTDSKATEAEISPT